ncbi:pentatricopeptide repeat-containing protein At3g49740-like [Elaeis guineensis]|uniref:pentatricopeptide repeat-containing protein At3g49740-like n=1 Tax=Elaeis guineensis var. tenera TaxID=51953 RepID=UPI003C6D3DD7
MLIPMLATLPSNLTQNPTQLLITLNALLSKLTRSHRCSQALCLFSHIHASYDISPDHYSLASALAACARLRAATAVPSSTPSPSAPPSSPSPTSPTPFSPSTPTSTEAVQLFDGMPKRNTAAWNAMITGFVHHGYEEFALKMFLRMHRLGVGLDKYTFASVMGCVVRQSWVSVINALVTMYFDCGLVMDAWEVFGEAMVRDEITYNALIAGLVRLGRDVEALMVIRMGLEDSVLVANAVVTMYSNCGDLVSAEQAFEMIHEKDIVSWNALITGYVLSGFPVRSLEIFSALIKSRLMPNSYTLSTVLSTCATMPARKHGKEVHAYILRDVTKCDTLLMNSLVTMYGKCGELDYGSKVFDGMLQRDIVSWNVIISAYAQNGDGHEAIHYFKMMQKSGIIPDNATFTSVLSACSHAGLVEEGRVIFTSMVQDYGIEPGVDHYSCIIDLLGRAGYLEEAERLINSMPCRVDSHIWWALLSACSTHGNARLGRIAAKFLLETEPENPTIYVLLSNIIAADGKWEEASSLRDRMQRNGVAKKPGCSWIEDIQSTTDSW